MKLLIFFVFCSVFLILLGFLTNKKKPETYSSGKLNPGSGGSTGTDSEVVDKIKNRHVVTFPNHWRTVLLTKVPFYVSLSANEKLNFESRVQDFLLSCTITGVDVEVDLTDRLLVASSAIIPIFAFPDWTYSNLSEVLLYPDSFNHQFESDGDSKRTILGMVGTGYMEGKMILSKRALHHGFSNNSDKKNTAIHEFVHLIDKMDGVIDGIPSILMERHYVLPWLELLKKKIEELNEDDSDINPYGGTSNVEFYAVISEYFFERPKLLQKKHPKLYGMLEKIFNQKMTSRELQHKKMEVGRNSPCPCGSGEKFKHCCALSAT